VPRPLAPLLLRAGSNYVCRPHRRFCFRRPGTRRIGSSLESEEGTTESPAQLSHIVQGEPPTLNAGTDESDSEGPLGASLATRKGTTRLEVLRRARPLRASPERGRLAVAVAPARTGVDCKKTAVLGCLACPSISRRLPLSDHPGQRLARGVRAGAGNDCQNKGYRRRYHYGGVPSTRFRPDTRLDRGGLDVESHGDGYGRSGRGFFQRA